MKRFFFAAFFSSSAGLALPARAQIVFPEISEPVGKISATFWENNGVYILTGSAFLAAAALFFILRRTKAPLPTPYEIATAELHKARAADDDNAKAYALCISGAVRGYISSIYRIPAPERTTYEFLELASLENVFDAEARSFLEKILRLADMAKFARHDFLSAEREELYAAAEAFIESDNKKRAEAHKGK